MEKRRWIRNTEQVANDLCAFIQKPVEESGLLGTLEDIKNAYEAPQQYYFIGWFWKIFRTRSEMLRRVNQDIKSVVEKEEVKSAPTPDIEQVSTSVFSRMFAWAFGAPAQKQEAKQEKEVAPVILTDELLADPRVAVLNAMKTIFDDKLGMWETTSVNTTLMRALLKRLAQSSEKKPLMVNDGKYFYDENDEPSVEVMKEIVAALLLRIDEALRLIKDELKAKQELEAKKKADEEERKAKAEKAKTADNKGSLAAIAMQLQQSVAEIQRTNEAKRAASRTATMSEFNEGKESRVAAMQEAKKALQPLYEKREKLRQAKLQAEIQERCKQRQAAFKAEYKDTPKSINMGEAKLVLGATLFKGKPAASTAAPATEPIAVVEPESLEQLSSRVDEIRSMWGLRNGANPHTQPGRFKMRREERRAKAAARAALR